MTTSAAAAATTTELHPVFIEQARALIAGGELLPGGPEQGVPILAKRLQQAAETQTPLRIKLGLDPTRPDLHLGHSVVLRKLRAFQDLGHQAVLIIGDATALIGDPSGRNHTRPPLTPEEVQQNAQTYLEQASKIIDVRKAEIVHNNQWFKGMGLADFLALAAKVTVAQLLVREDFAKRYAENQPIALHELFYPLMQGYDSVEVRADVELGGTDQRFNNLVGRDMQLAFAKENETTVTPQLVLLMPLLEGTDGKIKMSKSYPLHCINLTDTAEDLFGKVMSIPDSLIVRYEELLTPLTAEQVAQHRQLLEQIPEGFNPRDLKVGLAKWLVSQYHSVQAADEAEEAFVARFKNKQLPTEMPEASLKAGQAYPLLELMVTCELAPSKAEAKRLVQGGAVKLHLSPNAADTGLQKLDNPDEVLKAESPATWVLQAGKHRFIRLLLG